MADISGERNGRERQRLFIYACWFLWIGLTVVCTILALLHPGRSVFHVYRHGVAGWWSDGTIYSAGIHGYLYLPASILLFSPFAALGVPLDDVAWRIFSVALFTYGLWRLVRLAAPGRAGLCLAALLLLLLPSAGTDIQRSQAGVAMVATMFIAAAEMAEIRWGRAAFWLCLGTALKPLVLVLVLLYGVLLPPLRLRLLLGLAIVLAVSFIHPHPGYVIAQYADFVDKMLIAAAPGDGRWNEVAQMLERFGLPLPEAAQTALRAAAALATLALAAVAVRRQHLKDSAITVLSLGIAYLLVFNPRTELGGYMDLAAVAGLYGGMAWYAAPRRAATAILLALLMICLGTQSYGDWIYRPTDVWLKPALGLVFLAYLGWRVLRRGTGEARARHLAGGEVATPGIPSPLGSGPRP